MPQAKDEKIAELNLKIKYLLENEAIHFQKSKDLVNDVHLKNYDNNRIEEKKEDLIIVEKPNESFIMKLEEKDEREKSVIIFKW